MQPGARPRRAQYAEALDAAHRAALEFVQSLSARRVTCSPTPALCPPPPQGIGFEAALAHFRESFESDLCASAGPRYFGFVTGGSTPAALAADWLTSAYDQNLASDFGSVAAAIERSTVRAYADLFGLPEQIGGFFVSGATQANLVALATARQWAYEQLGLDVAEQGIHGAPPLRVIGGAPHSSIAKALSVLGLGRAALEQAPCLPGRTVLDLAALRRRLTAERARPTILVASAGEVNTGDFDDITALAELAKEHGAWLHVDGAFGLFAALLPDHAHLLQGVEHADSVTVDVHKWLNAPYDSAIAFSRHLALQRKVFRATAAYIGDAPDPVHFTPESSRRFRALPAWLSLAAYGREGIAEWVSRDCTLASALASGLAQMPELELLDEVRLNIVCFALRSPSTEMRDEFLARLQADGRTFMSQTTLFGRPAVRAALSNWATEEEDIEVALKAVREVLDGLRFG
jgi:glutamate/tyrosine decarboxylase-like PLP-dependent enzyme